MKAKKIFTVLPAYHAAKCERWMRSRRNSKRIPSCADDACYAEALSAGADLVVMLHADHLNDASVSLAEFRPVFRNAQSLVGPGRGDTPRNLPRAANHPAQRPA